MREVLSFLFDRITDPLGLPIAWYWEWIILAVIELAAFAIAFRAVGDLYDGGMNQRQRSRFYPTLDYSSDCICCDMGCYLFCDLACKAYFCTLDTYCKYPWRHSGDCCNYLSDCSLYPKRW